MNEDLRVAIESRTRKLHRFAFAAPETLGPNERRYVGIKQAELALLKWAADNPEAGAANLVVRLARAINSRGEA